jgi:NHL repeat
MSRLAKVRYTPSDSDQPQSENDMSYLCSMRKARETATTRCIFQSVCDWAFIGMLIVFLTSRSTPAFASEQEANWTVVAGQPGTVDSTKNFHDDTFVTESSKGFANGRSSQALFSGPGNIAADKAGNVYVLDQADTVVRKIAPDGTVSTAGTLVELVPENGPLEPTGAGIAVDSGGNIFASEVATSTIWRIGADGRVSIYAGRPSHAGYRDGPAAEALFSAPKGLAIDKTGNLYVADSGNNAIRKISPDGAVSMVAGGYKGFSDGPARRARFENPTSIALDEAGNVYVAEYVFVEDEGQAESSTAIRRIGTDGIVSTLGVDNYFNARKGRSGPEPAVSDALLPEHDTALAIDRRGYLLFWTGIQRIGRLALSPTNNVGAFDMLDFGSQTGVPRPVYVTGIVMDERRNLYVVESGHQAVYKVAVP